MASENERFQVDQLDHVEMFVPDRYQAAEWYQRVLGIKIIREFEFWAEDTGGPLMISSDGGSTKLALFEGKPPGKESTIGFHRVAFRVGAKGFMQFLTHMSHYDLKDVDGQPVTRDTVVDHDRSFSIYFCDPFGHRLEVTTYDYQEIAALLEG